MTAFIFPVCRVIDSSSPVKRRWNSRGQSRRESAIFPALFGFWTAADGLWTVQKRAARSRIAAFCSVYIPFPAGEHGVCFCILSGVLRPDCAGTRYFFSIGPLTMSYSAKTSLWWTRWTFTQGNFWFIVFSASEKEKSRINQICPRIF